MTRITNDMLTDWYPPGTWPARVGVYELLNTSTGMRFFSKWDGAGWHVAYLTVTEDARSLTYSVAHNRWPWRGLTEEGNLHANWPRNK